MAASLVSRNALLLGTCVPCLKRGTSKIRVRKLELDENLNMYFKTDYFFFAQDKNKTCKTGDIVLIQQLPEKLSTLLTHKVLEVVYPLGDITDPISGKKVVAGMYRDEIKQRTARFGASEGFDYENAPERGWQEDKRDFTHKESYVRYHEFNEKDHKDQIDQPYALR